jgi:hypothetical protein
MKREEVQEIIACLSGERFLFHYYKDRYCLDLLKMALATHWLGRKGAPVQELKSSPFANLLQKPIVKAALALAGNGVLGIEHLDMQWPMAVETYVLTLDSWGSGDSGWDQTSRPGSNLVLQLNFSNRHDLCYESVLKPDRDGPFTYDCHPVHQGHRNTMAWVRIDCSFQSDEALIEEIQTDWLRSALQMGNTVKILRNHPARLQRYLERRGIGGDSRAVERYLEHLAVHQKTWHEAALDAAINFIRDVLGLKKIFYHTYGTGRVLKRIRGDGPPISLYTQLPKKFCFALTDEAPKFLQENSHSRRRMNCLRRPQWYALPAG